MPQSSRARRLVYDETQHGGDVGNAIPEQARQAVKVRTFGRCLRCGGPGAEWHHRRSRSVKAGHRHCPCNGVWLCRTCHAWAHSHPFDARGEGYIVSRAVFEPGEVPVQAYFAALTLSCDGRYTYYGEDTRSEPFTM